MDSSRLAPNVRLGLRSHNQARLETLRSYRIAWWSYWSELAAFYLPHRYRWFITPNQYRRGSPLNQAIVDETGLMAARTLATGMFSGLTDPTKVWFRLGLRGVESLPEGPEKQWLADSTSILHEVYHHSNFYETLAQSLWDEVVFGTGARIQLEDHDDVVRFYNPPLGAYFIAVNNRLEPDTLYEEYAYTNDQTVKEFGLANVSAGVAQAQKSASSIDTEIVICRSIEPNDTMYFDGKPLRAVPPHFKFRQVYWEQGSAGGGTNRNGHILRVEGFHEDPLEILRWSVTANDAYGRGPGMDALPAVRQLQIEQRRKAEGIDKMVRPPMVAPASMKNEPVDTLPGGVTYSTDPNAGFKPAFQVEPRIQELMEDLKEVQARVEEIFHNPLFKQFPTDTVRTATEVDAIKGEKVVLLGPVVTRNHNSLSKTIARTFAICQRRGILPPAPPSIAGHPIEIKYVSMLSELQNSTQLTSIERLFQFAGGVAGIKPEVLDNLNVDRAIDLYGDGLTVDPSVLNPADVVAQIRQNRAAQQQAQAALAVGQAGAQGAATLSKADVGGGRNALQAIVGDQAA